HILLYIFFQFYATHLLLHSFPTRRSSDLFLMIPIPAIVYNQIAFPLQTLAARMATSLLSLAGVPVLRDGNVIRLPAVSLEVAQRSEEHTSELQSRFDLVCRLLLEKKKKQT